MISGLRGFDRLVAKTGQDEAIRLVEKWLVCGSIATKHLCHGRVVKKRQANQSQYSTEHE